MMNAVARPVIYRHFHRIAWLAVALTLCVVVFGAFVRLSDAGLSCPDWPTCYGRAAWPKAVDEAASHVASEIRPFETHKAWREQVHRHIAASLGVLVLVLALLAARRRRWGIAQILAAAGLVGAAIPLYMHGEHVAASALAILGEALLLFAALRWSNIDLARAAAQRLGIEVEFKPIDWNAKEAELSGKRVDVLWNGLTITEERKKNIAFTAPYMQNHQIVVVKADAAIKAKADLAGKVVGVQDGSSAVEAIEKDAATAQSFKQLKKYGDNVTALMDLSAGRVDAVVLDEVVGRYYSAKKPGEYAVLDEHFGTEDYGVGLRQDDAALRTRLDEVLTAMKGDGSGARIAEQWFGKNILK